jgi:hypothetical protein
MTVYKEPRDYGAPIQQLKNGKTLNVSELLDHATEVYQNTRRNYRLSQTNNVMRELASTRKPHCYKYTREEAIWISQHKPHEVAQRYGLSLRQAYTTRYYVRNVYGL